MRGPAPCRGIAPATSGHRTKHAVAGFPFLANALEGGLPSRFARRSQPFHMLRTGCRALGRRVKADVRAGAPVCERIPGPGCASLLLVAVSWRLSCRPMLAKAPACGGSLELQEAARATCAPSARSPQRARRPGSQQPPEDGAMAQRC